MKFLRWPTMKLGRIYNFYDVLESGSYYPISLDPSQYTCDMWYLYLLYHWLYTTLLYWYHTNRFIIYFRLYYIILYKCPVRLHIGTYYVQHTSRIVLLPSMKIGCIEYTIVVYIYIIKYNIASKAFTKRKKNSYIIIIRGYI